MSLLADVAIKSSINDAAASAIKKRLMLLMPLVDLLCGERQLADVGDFNETDYAAALAVILEIAPDAFTLRVCSTHDIDDLPTEVESYALSGLMIVSVESKRAKKELGFDPVLKNIDLIREAMRDPLNAFYHGYGKPLKALNRGLRNRILSVPLGMTALVVNYAAHDYVVGLRRIGAFVRQLSLALPIGTLDADDSLNWNVLID
jgi:hypothetical protein